MRFIAGGPSLPDELLSARDAGQVLFFCGAGVSQAEAGLPNFSRLAENVLSLLGSALDSPARRLFDASQAFEEASGLTGPVATDRIFGMLEREFEPEELREAVSIALRPEPGYGIGAHRMVLDLSRTRAGVARLVTTNFDLLFEECDPSLLAWNPPHLPDPRRELDFRGIIHLHGRVDETYSQACDNEFVLSSADFGRAYLADGWATRYIQELLRRFKIVFLGYSADDPPVQYLLEALNRSDERPNALYAFQSGDIAQAAEQWEHKGVQPLPYESANRHAALWDTLQAWAERARDIDGWHRQVITSAGAGPAAAAPFERGMIAHIASTRAGARHLATTAEPLPALWLNVFDRRMRYGEVGQTDLYDDTSPRFDPFDAFGLDSDEAPAATDPDDRFARRPLPEGAWDGFASTEEDRANLEAAATGQLRGSEADQVASLPQRLWQLGVYIVRVAHQPAALWWAAHQSRLHPHVVQHLRWALRHEAARFSDAVRDGWRALLAAWDDRRNDANQERYDIEARVKSEGWSTARVREAMEMYRPMLEVKPTFGVVAPSDHTDLKLGDILRIDVEYPRPHEPLRVPDDQLVYGVGLLRGTIEHAIVLEQEVRGRDYIYFDTIRPDDGKEPNEDGFRLTGLLVTYTNHLARLTAVDRPSARAEIAKWPHGVTEVFTRLRIWAASRSDLLDPAEAGETFCALDEMGFWTDRQERDLLFALRDRWAEMPPARRAEIEHRLLTGHFPWPEPRHDEAVVNAHYRLSRLQWLHDQGVEFGFDFDTEIARLRAIAPDWEPRFAAHAARSQVGEAYTVETDTDPGALVDVPLQDILDKAAEAGGRDFFDHHIERRPFRGLAETKPVRALGALADAKRRDRFDRQAWAAMLHAGGKSATSDRLLCLIGQRLARLPTEQLNELAHPVSEWLRDRGEKLLVDLPRIFDLVWNALIAALQTHPLPKKFRRPDAGWVDDGLNMPTGRLVDAMLKDPTKTDFKRDEGLPDNWKSRLDQLLNLPGDHRHHAIAMITPQLNWLYNVDPEWTERQLVILAERGGDDADAFWGGYFWGARTPQLPLYERLKPSFVALARNGTKRRDHANKLAGMLLAGWGGDKDTAEPDRLIPDVELREILIHADDELRTQMLGYLERWSRESDSRWGDRIIPFLQHVWPRQTAVRTPRVSARLADLALASPERFEEIVGIIRPWLKPIKGPALRVGPFLKGEEGIAVRQPAALLDLLWAILAEDPMQWPYETGKLLDSLAAAEATVGDLRLAELRRRQALL